MWCSQNGKVHVTFRSQDSFISCYSSLIRDYRRTEYQGGGPIHRNPGPSSGLFTLLSLGLGCFCTRNYSIIHISRMLSCTTYYSELCTNDNKSNRQ